MLHYPVCLRGRAVECCTVHCVYEGVLLNVALSSLSTRACCWTLHCPVCLPGRAVECCTVQCVYEGVLLNVALSSLLNVALSSLSTRACCWTLHCPVCLRGCAVEDCTVQFVYEGVLLNVALSSLSTRVCHFSTRSKNMSCDNTLLATMSRMLLIGIIFSCSLTSVIYCCELRSLWSCDARKPFYCHQDIKLIPVVYLLLLLY